MPSDVRHSRANLRSTLEVDRLTAIRAPLNLTPTKPRAAELCLKLPMYRIYGPVIQCRRAKYSTRYHCESRTAAIPIVTGEFCNWLRFLFVGETMIRHASPSRTITATSGGVHGATTWSCLIVP